MIIYYLIGIILTSILFSVLLYFAYTKKVKFESEDFKEPKDPILGRLDSTPVEEYTRVGEELKNIPIYILNLEKEKERKVHTENLLNKLGFTNYTFVIPVSLKDAEKSPELWDVGMPIATKSHVLSYTFCMKKAIENNYKEFIIMEDDLDVYYDGVSITDVYRAAKHVDWDLLYYEFCFENCSRTIKLNKNLYKLESPNCAGFILFNLESAKRILAEFTLKTRDTSIIDLTFQTLSKKKKINSYGFPILRQKDTFGSSIPSSYTYTRKNKFSPICRIRN